MLDVNVPKVWGLTTDSQANSYIVGTNTIETTGEKQSLLVKYNANGNVLWGKSLGEPASQTGGGAVSANTLANGALGILVTANGTVWSWGENFAGQLGDGTTINKTTPFLFSASGVWNDFNVTTDKRAGIKIDGSLWAWGDNYAGVLATGDNNPTSSPIDVSAGASWRNVYISLYGSHMHAIKTDGTLWGCGYNFDGELGSNDTYNYSSFVEVAGGGTWKSVAPGSYHTLAIKSDNSLWVCGYNDMGQLGTNDGANRSSPVTTIAGGNNWAKAYAADRVSAAIKTDGTLWTWGSNALGMLGIGNDVNSSSPSTTAGGGSTWSEVTIGNQYMVAVKTDGTLWSWGDNYFGQLGDNTNTPKSSPIQVGTDINWKDVSAFNYTSGAIKTDDTLWTWGYNVEALAQVAASPLLVPTQVQSPSANLIYHVEGISVKSDTNDIVVGGNYSSNGSLKDIVLAKYDSAGSLLWKKTKADADSYSFNLTDITVDASHNVIAVTESTSINYPVTLMKFDQNGNEIGVIGISNYSNTSYFNAVTSISAGRMISAAIKDDGTLWTWGRVGANNWNDGYNTILIKSSPVTLIGGGTTWSQVSCSYGYEAAAVKTDGTVWKWRVDDLTPTSFIAGNDWAQVEISSSNATFGGIKTDNSLWTWGVDAYGQLGHNTQLDTLSPVSVSGGGTWSQVSFGYQHSTGIKTDGSLWTWGYSHGGPISDGSLYSSPISVDTPAGKTWNTLALSSVNLFAVNTDGILWASGGNLFGETGTLVPGNPIDKLTQLSYYNSYNISNPHVASSSTNDYYIVSDLNVKGSDNGLNLTRSTSDGIVDLMKNIYFEDDVMQLPVPSIVGYVYGNSTYTVENTGIAIDLSDNVYISATIQRKMNYLTEGPSLDANSYYQVLTKTDSTGNLLWQRFMSQANGGFANVAFGGKGLSTDSNNNVYINMTSKDSTTNNYITFPVFVKFNSSGVQQYQRGVTSVNYDTLTVEASPYGIDLDSDGSLIITADYQESTANLVPLTYKVPNDGTLTGQYGNVSVVLETSTPITANLLGEIAVANPVEWQDFGISEGFAAGIKLDGTIWSWGENGFGQLGNDSNLFTRSPVTLAGGGTWSKISVGVNHVAAIKSDGSLWTWGSDTYRQLGDGDGYNAGRSSPGTTSGGGTDWQSISAGAYITAAIKSDGTLWTWGSGASGALGSNAITYRSSPETTVGGGTTWSKISAGQGHMSAIKLDGSLWTWGRDDYGQLGHGTTVNRSSPITVAGGGSWVRVHSGLGATAAIKSDGSLWTWGEDSTAGRRSSPATVISGGGTTWSDVAITYKRGSAIKSDGSLWVWGDNVNNLNTIGDGSTINQINPVLAFGGSSNWSNVYQALSAHNAALKTDNVVRIWGYNSSILNSSIPAVYDYNTIKYFPDTGDNDDGYWELSLPWNIDYNGGEYASVFVGTNSYLTFNAGSVVNGGFSSTNPPLDKILISANNNSVQRIFQGTSGTAPNRIYRIRFEGTTGTNIGLVGTTDLNWEAVFYENSVSRIDIQFANTPLTTTGVYSTNKLLANMSTLGNRLEHLSHAVPRFEYFGTDLDIISANLSTDVGAQPSASLTLIDGIGMNTDTVIDYNEIVTSIG